MDLVGFFTLLAATFARFGASDRDGRGIKLREFGAAKEAGLAGAKRFDGWGRTLPRGGIERQRWHGQNGIHGSGFTKKAPL